MIPTLPLALRNRLAETILAALHDAHARAELASLTTEDAARGWLDGGEDRWVTPLLVRARRACRALDNRPLHAPVVDLATALGDAAVLYDAGLHFEVHEILEPHWAASEGETREALQGLIQAAVGFQHLANGNMRGARSLLADAGARLHGRALAGRDLDDFARTLAGLAQRAGDGEPIAPPPFPETA